MLNIDIKNDSVFKNIYLSETGRIHMCNIISNLYNLDYDDLVINMKIYNNEHPNYNINYKSSYSDVVYQYKNKIFIIEMNKTYYKKIIDKNHFYLLFRHISDANNENGYNGNKETYLIDIDNFDIKAKRNLYRKNERSKFIIHGRILIEEDNICIYNNIHTTRINLDYLKNIKYNYNTLTNIERDCLIFINKDKEILKKYGSKIVKEVLEMLEVIEIDGKLFPLYNKEEFEESLREEAVEQGIEQGIEQGRLEEKISLAKMLKLKKYSDKEIIELTGLSIDKVKKL